MVNLASRCANFIATSGLATDLSGSEDPEGHALLAACADAQSDIAALYQAGDYSEAMRRVMTVADQANAYVAKTEPWKLAKDPANGVRLRHVSTVVMNVFWRLCVFLAPVLPTLATDVGELKRLVTVLLQEIDDWPAAGLLIAATNHADLLDPAVWRRFEMRVDFPMPTEAAVRQAIETFLGLSRAPAAWNEVLAVTLRGLSFSDIAREVMLARRAAVTRDIPLEDALGQVVQSRVGPLPRRERGQIAMWLTEAGISQRQVHELTGVSRDTIRKKTKPAGADAQNEE